MYLKTKGYGVLAKYVNINTKCFSESNNTSLQKEGVNFAKTAEKFEKFLGSEIVNPEKWRRRQQNVFSSD